MKTDKINNTGPASAGFSAWRPAMSLPSWRGCRVAVFALALLASCAKDPAEEHAPAGRVEIVTVAALPSGSVDASGSAANAAGATSATDPASATARSAANAADATSATDPASAAARSAANAAGATSATDPAPATGPATRAVADPAQAMDLYFARADQNASGAYDVYGTTAFKATRPGGTGAQSLTFDPKQYYLPNGKSSKLAGWYPGGAAASGDASGKGFYDGSTKTVTWKIDGSQDVMTATAQEGSLNTSALAFAFAHRLAQVQFYPYAENAEVQAQWGKIKAIRVEKQRNTCSFALATAETSGAITFTGEQTNAFTAGNLAEATLPVGSSAATIRFGDPVMIAPQGADYMLRVSVDTELGGTITALAPARAYAEGSVTRLKLQFKTRAFTVEPSLMEISDWIGGAARTYPYVQEGKYIVSWDLLGSSGPIHVNWTAATMPVHNERSADNAVAARFEVAKDDCDVDNPRSVVPESNPNEYYWATALLACAAYTQDGSWAGQWRLPTKKELELIFAKKELLSSITNTDGDFYWSATESNSDDAYAWRGGANDDDWEPMPKTPSYYSVRCVRDIATDVYPSAYPYLSEGKYIVSKDAFGSSGETIHVNWTVTPVHDEHSADNAVAAKFEVAAANCSSSNPSSVVVQINNKYPWDTAVLACAAYTQAGIPAGDWRLPTIKEFELIYAKRDLLTAVDALPSGDYWSATDARYEEGSAWYMRFYDYDPWVCDKTNPSFVRCVRDVD